MSLRNVLTVVDYANETSTYFLEKPYTTDLLTEERNASSSRSSTQMSTLRSNNAPLQDSTDVEYVTYTGPDDSFVVNDNREEQFAIRIGVMVTVTVVGLLMTVRFVRVYRLPPTSSSIVSAKSMSVTIQRPRRKKGRNKKESMTSMSETEVELDSHEPTHDVDRPHEVSHVKPSAEKMKQDVNPENEKSANFPEVTISEIRPLSEPSDSP